MHSINFITCILNSISHISDLGNNICALCVSNAFGGTVSDGETWFPQKCCICGIGHSEIVKNSTWVIAQAKDFHMPSSLSRWSSKQNHKIKMCVQHGRKKYMNSNVVMSLHSLWQTAFKAVLRRISLSSGALFSIIYFLWYCRKKHKMET